MKILLLALVLILLALFLKTVIRTLSEIKEANQRAEKNKNRGRRAITETYGDHRERLLREAYRRYKESKEIKFGLDSEFLHHGVDIQIKNSKKQTA